MDTYFAKSGWAELVQSIRENPDDDTPKLVAADFIEDDFGNDHPRVQLIRTSLELKKYPPLKKLNFIEASVLTPSDINLVETTANQKGLRKELIKGLEELFKGSNKKDEEGFFASSQLNKKFGATINIPLIHLNNYLVRGSFTLNGEQTFEEDPPFFMKSGNSNKWVESSSPLLESYIGRNEETPRRFRRSITTTHRGTDLSEFKYFKLIYVDKYPSQENVWAFIGYMSNQPSKDSDLEIRRNLTNTQDRLIPKVEKNHPFNLYDLKGLYIPPDSRENCIRSMWWDGFVSTVIVGDTDRWRNHGIAMTKLEPFNDVIIPSFPLPLFRQVSLPLSKEEWTDIGEATISVHGLSRRELNGWALEIHNNTPKFTDIQGYIKGTNIHVSHAAKTLEKLVEDIWGKGIHMTGFELNHSSVNHNPIYYTSQMIKLGARTLRGQHTVDTPEESDIDWGPDRLEVPEEEDEDEFTNDSLGLEEREDNPD